MVVDDASMIRMVVRDTLESSGRYRVIAEHDNGLSAFEALRGLSPDIVLLDVEMPVMDGPTFVRFARAKTRAKIVVLSASASLGSTNARELRRWGVDAITEKPRGPASPELAQSAPLLRILDLVAA